MGVKGKLIASQELRSKGDVFHQLLKTNPHGFSTLSPQNIQGCALHEGEFGKPGSVILWNYTQDGKEKVTKEVIEAVDDDKKFITLRVIEGDLYDEYKSFVVTFNFNADSFTCILDYETANDDVGPPFSFLRFVVDVVNDAEKAAP